MTPPAPSEGAVSDFASRTAFVGLGATILTALVIMTPTTSIKLAHAAGQADALTEPLTKVAAPASTATATFGGGCFWCTEAVFEATRGVSDVVSGYAGGDAPSPTYEQVCTGKSGHAEVIQISYDPAVISYAELLEVFFRTHDPTTLNQQGADRGTQYRSVVFYHDDEQRAVAEDVVKRLGESGAYSGPIVTEVSPAPTFYAAEAYHQDYFANNPEQGYCRAVVAPKLDKFRKAFADRLKD